jgi:polyhydroxyalkanoate synthesis repressor PhaR
MLVKKYSNRRLYDTIDSRYITLEELTHKIRKGADLTQQTLTQIILESRGGARLLPVPLLLQLIRMGDEALAEFFGRYMSWALEMYLRARTQAQAISPYMPLATLPFSTGNALARMVMGASPWQDRGAPGPQHPQDTMQQGMPQGMPGMPPVDMAVPPAPPTQPGINGLAGMAGAPMSDDLAALRRELEDLKNTVREGSRRGAKPKRRARAK